MCGRYVLVSKVKEIEKRFNVKVKHPERLSPRVNIGPGSLAPIICSDEPGEARPAIFGFTPAWSDKRMYLFNARAEGDLNKEDDPHFTGGAGILQKPAFRGAIRSRRCLVPVDAFIEGPKTEKLSKPFCVYLTDGKKSFALAGIWEDRADRETGEIERSFAIITTVSNELMQTIGHHRSPVILDREDELKWLDPETPLSDITAMLRPYPADRMNAYPISPNIKHPAAEGLALLAPVGQRVFPEYD
jgi:putative SOS response-associated peptidase YedK